AAAAQQQVVQRDKAADVGGGQYRREPSGELPPVAERRPGQVVQTLLQLRVRLPEPGVLYDADGAEELQPGLAEVERGEVSLQRRLGVVGAAVQLGQRQRQPPAQ